MLALDRSIDASFGKTSKLVDQEAKRLGLTQVPWKSASLDVGSTVLRVPVTDDERTEADWNITLLFKGKPLFCKAVDSFLTHYGSSESSPQMVAIADARQEQGKCREQRGSDGNISSLVNELRDASSQLVGRLAASSVDLRQELKLIPVGEGVRIRSEPSVTAPVIGLSYPQQELSLSRDVSVKPQDLWVAVESSKGTEGFVSANLLTEANVIDRVRIPVRTTSGYLTPTAIRDLKGIIERNAGTTYLTMRVASVAFLTSDEGRQKSAKEAYGLAIRVLRQFASFGVDRGKLKVEFGVAPRAPDLRGDDLGQIEVDLLK